MADEKNRDKALEIYEKLHEEGDFTDLVKAFYSKIDEIFKEKKNVLEFHTRFPKCLTDFQRTSLLLELCTKADLVKDGGIVGLPSKLEDVTEGMGKKDDVSEAFRQKSQHHWEMGDRRNALKYLTYSVFYAESDEQKFNSIVSRFFLLYNMENYEDALKDSRNALGIQPKMHFLIYFYTAQCCMKLNKYPEALEYFKLAKEVELDDEIDKEKYGLSLDYGIKECEKSPKSGEPESKWSSYYPEPPSHLASQPRSSTPNRNKSNLPSVKEGVLELINTKERGWTLKTTRNIYVGEVLLTEKPYVSVLNNPRTENCYHCYRRCHSLLPCSGCPYVGFCSEKCASGALSNDSSLNTGTGRHNYECGILPFILLNKFSSRMSENQSYTGGVATSHLAYRCIANTDPDKLRNYLTAPNTKAFKSKKGHQAFKGEKEIRKNPPKSFDSSDYSSIAWLEACSGKRDVGELWQKTIAALFLTYCLWISGYPMDWKKIDKKEPQFDGKGTRPLSVSHVAACMLYHLQAATINCQDYFMMSAPSHDTPPKSCRSIATAIYPTISLINHSCNPTAVLVNTARGGAFLYALRSIPENEELSICYKYSYFTAPELMRRLILKCYYHFECNCEACTNKWFARNRLVYGTLKCQECTTAFSIIKRECKKCHSKETVKRLRELLVKLVESKSYVNRENEHRENCTELWREIQDLIRLDGAIHAHLQSLYKYLILQRFGNLSIEPF